MKAVQKSTLQESVYEEIYQAILCGSIAPGERLTLKKLTQDLNVSAMPVREALRRLEAKNFVKVQSNKQFSVNVISLEHFQEIYKIRILLEGYVAKIASIMRSDRSIEEMERINRQMMKARSPGHLIDKNRQFHRVIYQEARLPVFLEMIDILWERVTPYFYIISKGEKAYVTEKTYMENHNGIIRAIKEKKPSEVYEYLVKDLKEGSEACFLVLKREAKDEGPENPVRMIK